MICSSSIHPDYDTLHPDYDILPNIQYYAMQNHRDSLYQKKIVYLANF